VIPVPAFLLAAVTLAETRIVSVHLENLGGRRLALRIQTDGRLTGVGQRREGDDIVLTLSAVAAPGLPLPAPSSPVKAFHLEKAASGLVLRIELEKGASSRSASLEPLPGGTLLTLLVGAEAGKEEKPSEEVAALYKSLFPGSASDAPGAQGASTPESAAAAPPDDTVQGLRVGPLNVQPSLTASYIEAKDIFLDTPQPTSASYIQIEPKVGLVSWEGQLKGSYEARLRRATSIETLRNTTHLANLSLDLPLGPSLAIRASDHFARGTLEANEVDPGREYFYQLGPFTRNQVVAGARLTGAGRLDIDLSGSLNQVSFDGPSSFFDYRSELVSAGLGFQLTPLLRASLSYVYDRIPRPPQRPEAESSANSGVFTLDGEMGGLVRGQLAIGYRDDQSPQAAAGGQHYRGLTATASLVKEFSRASSLTLTGTRTTLASAFEQNAFYVDSSGQIELRAPLPYSLALRAGVGYWLNQYQTQASQIQASREDRIFGWSAGLGRSLTRWGYLRADYRREERKSNIPGLTNTTHAFVVQMGVGFLNVAQR